MKEHLIGQYQTIAMATRMNLEGVDHTASLVQTETGGNCIYWLVGHLTAVYDDMAAALGRPRMWTDEKRQVFARGSARLDTGAVTMPFAELVAELESSSTRLVDAIAALPESRYDEKAPSSPTKNPNETLLSLLFVTAFHQGYHCGQIAMQRHAAGLGGAIA